VGCSWRPAGCIQQLPRGRLVQDRNRRGLEADAGQALRGAKARVNTTTLHIVFIISRQVAQQSNIAVWLGRYRRLDATLSHMSRSRFGTLRAADRPRLVSTSQAWLCLSLVEIQLGRFCTAGLSVAALLCDSIKQQVTAAAQPVRQGQ
jgi:hypothetical protein